MLKKYNEHVLNEKKDVKAEKSGIEEKILKLFKDKPQVKAKSDKWPDSKCIYSIGDIKKYVGEDSTKVDAAFHDAKSRKDTKIKSISVKNLAFKESYPYYYDEEHTTKEEAEKCKADMEASQKPIERKTVKDRELPPERQVGKKKEVEAKPKAPRKPREKKVVTEGDLKVKAKAIVRRKKG